MDQVRQVLRFHHYAYRTEKTYSEWILRYIKFFGCKKHPHNIGKNEIESFLTYLAVHDNVSASTKSQAMNAILFLYRDVLDIAVDEEIEHIKAKRQPWLPIVMTQDEVKRVLNQMQGIHLLMAHLLYDSGLRLVVRIVLRYFQNPSRRTYEFTFPELKNCTIRICDKDTEKLSSQTH